MIALKLNPPNTADSVAKWLTKHIRNDKAPTWTVVTLNDGTEAFTHNAKQYYGKGFISLPEVKSKDIIGFTYIPGEDELENGYTGRFVEMLLNHVPTKSIKVVSVVP